MVLLVGAGCCCAAFCGFWMSILGSSRAMRRLSAWIMTMEGNAAKKVQSGRRSSAGWKRFRELKPRVLSDNLPLSRNRSWGISAKGEYEAAQKDNQDTFVFIVFAGIFEGNWNAAARRP